MPNGVSPSYWWIGALTHCSRISASAFSSQYVMPMSRYIVVAVVRCS